MSDTPIDLVMVGNLLVDDVVFGDGTTHMARAGGALFHAALAAAACGLSVGCTSVVGTDYPADALDLLRARGVSLDGVRSLAKPGVRAWLLHEDGTRRMVLREGRPTHEEVSPATDDVPPAWRTAPFAHVAPMPFTSQRAFVDAAGDGGRFLSLDPLRPVGDDTLDEWRGLTARCDAFLASDDEMRLTGDPRARLEALAVGRLRYAVHKRGAEGGFLLDTQEGALWRWEALPVTVRDVTGAGDAFAAGFLAALRGGLAVERALALGAAAASVAVEHGSREGLSTTDRAALDARAERVVVAKVG